MDTVTYDFNGDGTGYSSRATDAMWQLVLERLIEPYAYEAVPVSWDEFCEDNSLRGGVGSYGFDTSLQRQLEYETTMPDEMWLLMIDLVNWSEIVDTLQKEFNRVTDELSEMAEDEDETD